MQYLLSLDQGTSSTRAIIFDQNGELIKQYQVEHKQLFFKPGFSEHDPEEIWRNSLDCIEKVTSQIPCMAIIGCGITNQRETTIVWNRYTGVPYHNAIVWNDIRTSDICKCLSIGSLEKDRFRSKTGLPIASYFSLTKLMYLLANVPGLKEAAHCGDALFGTVDSYLLWKFSKGTVHKTDVSNASRTLMMDLLTLAWDDEILEECGIPKEMLPEICASVGEFCKIEAIESLRHVPITGNSLFHFFIS